MKKQATVEDFMKLPTVGETRAETLKKNGYNTFDDLVTTKPTTLQSDCKNTVLSSSTHIISAAVNHLDGSCPECGKSDSFIPSWKSRGNMGNGDDDIICENCRWSGIPSNLRRE
jgi:hypothetical protein